MKHLLVVDDEVGPRESLKAIFRGRFDVSTAASAQEAIKLMSMENIDLVLLDVIMPDKDGLEFLKELQGLYPAIPVVMISASTSVRPVVEAMRVGAFDYVTKPFDVDEIIHIVKRAMESTALHRRVEVLETEVNRQFPVKGIVGESPEFKAALEDVRKAAASDSTVLIFGESGTGKELTARLLHTLSNRREEPFVAVHCAGLPESLMESELFGHEKGAFTNADKQKPGRFDLAGSGTLFFDEVGEMTASTQVKLLRVLEEREFMRVGGTRVIRTNARIVTATARDLREEIKTDAFRDDLYYRLSVVPIQLPPLRERTGDIVLLTRHFIEQFARNLDAATRECAPETMDLLRRYPWPGNVRELRNIIERMIVLHGKDEVIRPEFLPAEFHGESAAPEPDMPPGSTNGQTLEACVSSYERRLIEKALQDNGGVQTRAAEALGTTRRILRYRMEKLNIPAKS